MRLISSAILSLCMILTSGPLMAAYSCNTSSAVAALSDYKIAQNNMNSAIQTHVANVDKIAQPVQAAFEWVGGELMVTGHTIEGLGRATIASIKAVVGEAQRTGQCLLGNAKKYRLFGSVNCVVVAGGNVILLSAATVNAGVTVVEFAIVKASDVFFDGAIRLSNSAANLFADNGAKVLALPFIVISKVLKGTKWIIATTVGYIANGVRAMVTLVGDILCNVAKAFSYLLKGQFKAFLKILIVGTLNIVVQGIIDLVDMLLVQPLRAIGKALKALPAGKKQQMTSGANR